MSNPTFDIDLSYRGRLFYYINITGCMGWHYQELPLYLLSAARESSKEHSCGLYHYTSWHTYFYVWIDRTRKHPDATIRRFFKLFAAYDLSASAVFLLRLGGLLLIERFSGWDVVICNLAAMCFSGIINFAINNLLIFSQKQR